MKLFALSVVGRSTNIGVFVAFIGFLTAYPASAAVLPDADWLKDKITASIGVVEVNANAKPRAEDMKLAAVMGNALVSSYTPETIDSNPILYGGVKVGKSKFRVPAGTTFNLTVTAYSSTVDQCDSDPFTTASGTHVHDGTVAANFLPFGTHVTFPDYSGNKIYTIEDRTNAKYSSRADIWMVSRGAALQFGKRHLRMVVVE